MEKANYIPSSGNILAQSSTQSKNPIYRISTESQAFAKIFPEEGI